MNFGHIENYAINNANGWSYGVSQLLLADGHIQGHNFISMIELRGKYDNERQNSTESK
jgi:hypothetical protein